MAFRATLLAAVLLVGCSEPDDAPVCDAPDGWIDRDGDGWGDEDAPTDGCDPLAAAVAGDCDDADEDIHPGADEDCAGAIDANCDGSVAWADADGDGWAACEDCNDTDPGASPAGIEWCDGQDNDCDGVADDGVTDRYYLDNDGDTSGDPDSPVDACEAPVGFVADDGDCDDTDAAVSPAGTEVCDGRDQDCDGDVDDGVKTRFYTDTDGDGYGDASGATEACAAPEGFVADATDCDDADAGTSPAATEACDGLDQDCDGEVDNGVGETFFADADGDGFGDASTALAACEAPAGFVSDAADCDDVDAAVSPAGVEACDGVDQDCDGEVDDGVGETFFADTDGDGFGDAATSRVACAAPAGFVSDATDCDDADAATSPAGVEACDGLDQDCDGEADDGAMSMFYADTDADGYGDATVLVIGCTAPSGYVADATDCDDLRDDVYPGATTPDCEAGVDHACDGAVQPPDVDGDGASACDDCDDGDAAVSPAATETCATAIDDDCDGVPNAVDAPGCTIFFLDDDRDGYGSTSNHCLCAGADGYDATNDDDCDDGDATISPAFVETWADGEDDNCDDGIDDVILGDVAPILTGAGLGAKVGESVAIAGDVDGDGFDDVVVGGPYSSTTRSHAGAAWLLRGPFTGDVDVTTGSRWDGRGANEMAGNSVSAPGDVTGDGLADVLVASIYDDPTYSNAGSIWLLDELGGASQALTSAPTWFVGDVGYGYLGAVMGPVGDLGDSPVDDVFLCEAAVGIAFVYYGPPPTGIVSAGYADVVLDRESGGSLGSSVAGGRDLDGDGQDDLAIGGSPTSSRAGGMYVVFGPLSGSMSMDLADIAIPGESLGDYFGTMSTLTEDVDGDGLADLFVGGVYGGGDGEAWLFSGGLASGMTAADATATFVGDHAENTGFEQVASPGDMDDDGYPDLVVTDYVTAWAASYGGTAYLFRGPFAGSTETTQADVSLHGGGRYEEAGYGLGSGGDLTGDGVPDLLVGGPGATSEDGAAYVVSWP